MQPMSHGSGKKHGQFESIFPGTVAAETMYHGQWTRGLYACLPSCRLWARSTELVPAAKHAHASARPRKPNERHKPYGASGSSAYHPCSPLAFCAVGRVIRFV